MTRTHTPWVGRKVLMLGIAALMAAPMAAGMGACSPSPHPAQPGSTASSPPTEAVLPSLEHDEGSDLGLEGPTSTPSPVNTPAWNKTEQDRATDIARRAANAFVDTTVSAQIWRQNLAGFLTEDAQALYSTASNESLPYGAVTKVGAPVQEKAHPMFIDVPVKVEGGDLTIKMIYNDDYTKLLVYRIDPADPGGSNG